MNRPSSVARLFVTLVLLSFVIASATSIIEAQQRPLGLAPGTPTGSYALSDIDTVNLFNGSVNVHLPFLSEGGRGQVRGSLRLAISSPAR